jgi:hypothetical protein
MQHLVNNDITLGLPSSADTQQPLQTYIDDYIQTSPITAVCGFTALSMQQTTTTSTINNQSSDKQAVRTYRAPVCVFSGSSFSFRQMCMDA